MLKRSLCSTSAGFFSVVHCYPTMHYTNELEQLSHSCKNLNEASGRYIKILEKQYHMCGKTVFFLFV